MLNSVKLTFFRHPVLQYQKQKKEQSEKEAGRWQNLSVKKAICCPKGSGTLRPMPNQCPKSAHKTFNLYIVCTPIAIISFSNIIKAFSSVSLQKFALCIHSLNQNRCVKCVKCSFVLPSTYKTNSLKIRKKSCSLLTSQISLQQIW